MTQIEEQIDSPLRDTPLPVSDMTGTFYLPEPIVVTMFQAMNRQSKEGPDFRGNEGLVFLAGTQENDQTFFTTVVVPKIQNTRGSVFVDAGEYGNCGKVARAAGLVVLAQVHSHPGSCCHHSDGDDRLIVMPFEGMLSIVVPNYARRLVPVSQWGVHQRHGRTWYLCRPESVAKYLIVPAMALTSKL